MKVFALMEWVPYEGGYLYGIYSSQEKAEAALSDLRRRRDMAISEVELDAAPEFVTI